jgi:hypothetical protein
MLAVAATGHTDATSRHIATSAGSSETSDSQHCGISPDTVRLTNRLSGALLPALIARHSSYPTFDHTWLAHAGANAILKD